MEKPMKFTAATKAAAAGIMALNAKKKRSKNEAKNPMLVVTEIEKSVTFYKKVPIAGRFTHCVGAVDQVVSSILDAIESRLCRGCTESPLF